jgi:hypothetical protein
MNARGSKTIRRNENVRFVLSVSEFAAQAGEPHVQLEINEQPEQQGEKKGSGFPERSSRVSLEVT